MRRIAAIGALALSMPVPCTAQTVVLAAGDQVTLAQGGDGALRPGLIGVGTLRPDDAAALGPRDPGRTGDAVEAIPAPPVAANAVDLRFLWSGDGGTVLIVENGLERAVSYRARIRERGGAWQAVPVCFVLAGRRGYERWPFAIDEIELSGFALTDWSPGDPPLCR
ncbi:hypothetical protein ACFQ1E_03910 [Sphingomonas canadensis]|uniref:Uncharacterized protein n=1 Tax=Sphingomonas canadensis TaxID=1219257 RepID=A0ABW3H2T4_9SPHN|nr:hypothetical protein [Sphingomonas canadensis]MCW3834611.1 hypothetical protein [Sphingomonas canadensis]